MTGGSLFFLRLRAEGWMLKIEDFARGARSDQYSFLWWFWKPYFHTRLVHRWLLRVPSFFQVCNPHSFRVTELTARTYTSFAIGRHFSNTAQIDTLCHPLKRIALKCVHKHGARDSFEVCKHIKNFRRVLLFKKITSICTRKLCTPEEKRLYVYSFKYARIRACTFKTRFTLFLRNQRFSTKGKKNLNVAFYRLRLYSLALLFALL